MYEKAGVELSVVHIGGDEVPRGAWSGSPICREFMDRNGLADTHALKDHFVRWLYGELDAKGIRLAGWQEIVMLPDGRHVNRELPGRRILSYGWNTQPGEGFDEVPYALANAGYPVVLCNVTNLYLDLAYNKHHMEPGHRWGGYVDARSTFDMLPYDIYKSVRMYPDGAPVDLISVSSGKESLSPGCPPQYRRYSGAALGRDDPQFQHGRIPALPENVRTCRTGMECESRLERGPRRCRV